MEYSEDWIKLIKGSAKCLYVLQVDRKATNSQPHCDAHDPKQQPAWQERPKVHILTVTNSYLIVPKL